jgi:hypothetical protein
LYSVPVDGSALLNPPTICWSNTHEGGAVVDVLVVEVEVLVDVLVEVLVVEVLVLVLVLLVEVLVEVLVLVVEVLVLVLVEVEVIHPSCAPLAQTRSCSIHVVPPGT